MDSLELLCSGSYVGVDRFDSDVETEACPSACSGILRENLQGSFVGKDAEEKLVRYSLSFEQRGALENSVTVLGEHSCLLCLVVKKCHVPRRIVRIEVKAC